MHIINDHSVRRSVAHFLKYSIYSDHFNVFLLFNQLQLFPSCYVFSFEFSNEQMSFSLLVYLCLCGLVQCYDQFVWSEYITWCHFRGSRVH